MVNMSTRESCTHYGNGPANAVCLLMEVCGIGDNIHAMPSVVSMVRSGIDVTIYCRPFAKSFWELTGATVYTIRRAKGGFHKFCIETGESINMNFVPSNNNKYGRIISLNSWSNIETNALGYSPLGMLELFAAIVKADLLESFSWLKLLRPQQTPDRGSYIVFAPESTEVWRSIPQPVAMALYHKLKAEYGNIVWPYTKPEWGPEKELKVKFETQEDFTNAIYNARCVISTESGTLNLAAALGVPVVGIHGLTEPGHTIEQFRRYIPDMQAVHVMGTPPANDVCQMPCYRHPSKGMVGHQCCGRFTEPLCMEYLDLESVMGAVRRVLDLSLPILSTTFYNHKENELCR